MTFPLFLVFCFALSLLLDGRPEHLGRVRLRCGYLILLSLGIQIVVFSDWWHRRGIGSDWKEALYLLSLLLLVAAVWNNHGVPGIALIGLGLFFNAVVIMANGGLMPASLSALKMAGIAASEATFETMRTANSALITPDTPLWFLSDIFALPKQIPFANVFSVGDLCLCLGGAIFLFDGMHAPTESSGGA